VSTYQVGPIADIWCAWRPWWANCNKIGTDFAQAFVGFWQKWIITVNPWNSNSGSFWY